MAVNGAAIRELRKENGMGIRTLAERTGLSRSYLSELERGSQGKGARAVESTVERIADAFSVDPSRLLVDEQPDVPEIPPPAPGERSPLLLDPKPAAAFIGITEYRLRAGVRAGEFTCVRDGRRMKFTEQLCRRIAAQIAAQEA